MNSTEVMTEESNAQVESVEKEDITVEDINSLSNLVHIESMKKDLMSQTDSLHSSQNELMAVVKGGDVQKDIIDEKLKLYTVDELEVLLKKDDFVNSFFTNEQGEPVEMNINFDTPEREIEFKRGLLTYFKSTQVAFDKIDEEYAKLDIATKEMNQNVGEALDTLSDNVLLYVDMMKDKANAISDIKRRRQILTMLKYIESGYNFGIFSELLDERPSVATNCVSELNSERRISNIGERYAKKLQKNGVKASLVEFASDIVTNKKSVEEQILIRDEQYKVPDLLVYSLIRYFAITDWDDNVRKAHASVCLTLRKLLAGEFVENVKDKIIDNMVTYIKKFPVD